MTATAYKELLIILAVLLGAIFFAVWNWVLG